MLLLHSFWGVNRQVKDMANSFADAGFTTLAPDLTDGNVFEGADSAFEWLSGADMNENASLVQSSLSILRRAQRDPAAPIGVVGLGSGASWALWLSARLHEEVAAVVTYYGSQTIPMDAATASFLCHWAEQDVNVSDLDTADLGLTLQMAGCDFRFEHHPGTIDGFAEQGRPGFSAEAEVVAFRQTTEFLAEHLELRAADDEG